LSGAAEAAEIKPPTIKKRKAGAPKAPLTVHQLAQQFEQRRFQGLCLVDDQHQGLLLAERLRHQEVFEDAEQVEVALGALRHFELLIDRPQQLIGSREVGVGDEDVGDAGVLLEPLARQRGLARPHRPKHQRQPAFGGDRPLGLFQSQVVGGRDIEIPRIGRG
jgi:hypothetical protein